MDIKEKAMSKDYYLFENENGKTGFLAGAVDVLSDDLQMILNYTEAFDADVFYVPDNNLSLLNDSVKKRMLEYKNKYSLPVSEVKINSIDFQLEEIQTDVYEYVYSQMKRYSSSEKLSDKVKEFLDSLEWYLQKPVCIYASKRMPDKNINVLGKIYCYEAWNYFFISYYDYYVLMIFGTDE